MLGGPCHVINKSAQVQRIGFLDFSDLVWIEGPTLGPVVTGDWDLDLGLTIKPCNLFGVRLRLNILE